MFKIRYKIIDDEDLEPWELRGADGYLEFQVVDEIYGIYLEEDIDVFSVSIFWWLCYFLESILILNETNYVLISDIERANTCIEIKKYDEEIYISEVFAEKPEGSSALESKIISNIEYKSWRDKQVAFSDYMSEILSKSKNYLEEIKLLNNKFNKNLENLELLIEKVSDLVDC